MARKIKSHGEAELIKMFNLTRLIVNANYCHTTQI